MSLLTGFIYAIGATTVFAFGVACLWISVMDYIGHSRGSPIFSHVEGQIIAAVTGILFMAGAVLNVLYHAGVLS